MRLLNWHEDNQEALEGPPSATLASLGICSGDLLHLLSPQLADPAHRRRNDVKDKPAVQINSPVMEATACAGATNKV